MMSTFLLNGFIGLYLSFCDLKSFNWFKSLNSVVTGYLNPKSVTNILYSVKWRQLILQKHFNQEIVNSIENIS